MCHCLLLPKDEVDSTNRKNIAIESSDTTLTERSGCRERTLEDSSCTEIEIAMRCAMDTSSCPNSNIPVVRDALGGSAEGGLFRFRSLASSRRIVENTDGALANKTLKSSTMPMSSSSDRCVSLAASSSSCAMLNETENARSEPSEFSVPAAVLMLGASEHGEAVRAAAKEAAAVRTPIALFDEKKHLILRRLIVGGAAPRRGRHPVPGAGGPRRGAGGEASTVVGVHFGHLVDFLRCGGRFTSTDVVAKARGCVASAAASVATCGGVDAGHLLRGCSFSRVCRAQLSALAEAKVPRLAQELGSGSVALGAACTMLATISVLAEVARAAPCLDCAAEVWFESCLQQLRLWRWLQASPPENAQQALAAQTRALQRGLLGLRVAQRQARRIDMDLREATLRIFVPFVRNAMFPRGRTLDCRTHPELCEYIMSEEFVDDCAMPPPPAHNYYVHSVALSGVRLSARSGGGSGSGSTCSTSVSSASHSSGSSFEPPAEPALGSEAIAALARHMDTL